MRTYEPSKYTSQLYPEIQLSWPLLSLLVYNATDQGNAVMQKLNSRAGTMKQRILQAIVSVVLSEHCLVEVGNRVQQLTPKMIYKYIAE